MPDTAPMGKKNSTAQSQSSSQGNAPVEMVPLDVSPENATWKDRTERKITSKNAEEKADALLDEASDLSFPASDPPAVSSTTRVERKPEAQKP